MREARSVAVTSTCTQEPQRPARLALETPQQPAPPPAPLPRLGTADRIVEALRRWLEEDM